MAREKFLLNLQTAAHLLSPEGQANGIRLDPGYMNDVLRRTTSWLTRRAVDGFDAKDFAELDPGTSERLVEAVGRIRAIADRLGRGPASAEDAAEAGPALTTILQILGPDLPGFRIYHKLKEMKCPEYVRDFAVGTHKDWTGDPAAYVWCIVTDESTVEQNLRDSGMLNELAGEALEAAGEDRRLYLSFRTESEQREEIESEQLEDLAAWARRAV